MDIKRLSARLTDIVSQRERERERERGYCKFNLQYVVLVGI